MDSWTRKQLLYMQKGSNGRALEYFKKCGIINEANRYIDYKSPIVQKYKSILTNEVEAEIEGRPLIDPSNVKKTKKEEDFFDPSTVANNNQNQDSKIEISEKVEEVK